MPNNKIGNKCIWEERGMDLKINASGLRDNILFAGMSADKDAENAVTPEKTVFGANLNLADAPLEEKKQEARKQAMKVVRDAWDGDHSIDDSIALTNEHYKVMEQEAYDANQQLKSLEEKRDALLEEYNGDTSNPEYIERSMGLSKQRNKFSADAEHAKNAMLDDVGDVHAIEKERLKSHGMVDATNVAEDIMDAAAKEMVGLVIQDAKDTIDDKFEETQDETLNVEQNVQQGLDDIKNSMIILEADLKGIQIDKEI